MTKPTIAAGAHRQLALLAVAMVLGMTPWFSATVAAPGMIAEWRTTPGVSAWLTIAVQLGFVFGTLVSALLLLSDRLSARRLAAGSSILVTVATATLAWRHTGPGAAMLLRFATGVALAGVYPPGIKIAAGWWQSRRGTAIGVLVGALTVGSAAPNLIRAVAPADQWRTIILIAAACALVSAALFGLAVRDGPFQSPSARFDPRALATVVRNRRIVLATAGYLGHMWELYAMWSSIGAFWVYITASRPVSPSAAPLLAFATIASGTVGCIVAGLAADRVGRPVVTIVAMAVRDLCTDYRLPRLSSVICRCDGRGGGVSRLWPILRSFPRRSPSTRPVNTWARLSRSRRVLGFCSPSQRFDSCRSGSTIGVGSWRTYRSPLGQQRALSQCGRYGELAPAVTHERVFRHGTAGQLPLTSAAGYSSPWVVVGFPAVSTRRE